MRNSGKILLAGYLAGIIIAYVAPVNRHGELNDHFIMGIRSDYLLHAVLFLPLPAFLLTIKTGKHISRAWLLLFTMSIPAAAECIHLFIPYRSFNPLDMLANVTGACLGATGLMLLSAFRKTAEKK
jgi:VanZ family protein